jgi:hypothetical protein
MSVVQKIKQRVSLHDVATMLNIDLPNRAGVKFRSPFRPDKNPSEVLPFGRRWYGGPDAIRSATDPRSRCGYF